jgi:ribonuclease BN (tRNA processing enzyme)
MALQIQMLGTGNAFAKKHFNNNALIYSNGFSLLIDCGITAPLALYELGKQVDEIDGICITHLHADHVGGLEELAFQLYYLYKKKIPLFVPSLLIEPLWENCLKAGLDTGEEGCNLQTFFEIVALEEKVKAHITPNLHIETIRTEHIPNKLSYSLVINNHLFYSADMRFNRALIHQIHHERQCKYILHDCQLQNPGTVHATLDELLTLPEEIQEKIQLMHYDDTMEDYLNQTGKMTFIKQHQLYEYPEI